MSKFTRSAAAVGGASVLVLMAGMSMTPMAKADPLPAKKVFVCKYVDTPGDGERLQTGNNPISVSVNSIKGDVYIGASFPDAHGRSVVIAWDFRKGGGQEGEPTIDDCMPTIPQGGFQ